jgi:hypothetical protein
MAGTVPNGHPSLGTRPAQHVTRKILPFSPLVRMCRASINGSLSCRRKSMPKRADSLEIRDTKPSSSAVADGMVAGAMLPLVRINGELFVVEYCLHFFPAVAVRPSEPEAD